MRFCDNCGTPQEAKATEAEVTAEESGEVTEKSVATAAEENAVTGTEESTAAGQEAHGGDRSPALTATVEGATEETAATIAGKDAVAGTEESTATEQEASGEAMHPAVPKPSAETSGGPVTTAAERDSALPAPAAEAVGEPVATATGGDVVAGAEKAAAMGQEASGETTKRKPHRLRAALFAVAAVAVAAVGATVLLHRMTAMTREHFVRIQAEALRQGAVPLEDLGAVLENSFSSDFVLSMQMSRSRLLVLSRGGNENHMLAAKALQRDIQIKVDLGRHLETAALSLEFGTDDSAKLNFDCFLDSEKFGYRIPQVSKQVFVLNYPEAFRQCSGGARFSAAELVALVPSEALLSASAARYGRVLMATFKPEEIRVKKRAYTSHVLKCQLDRKMKGEYTIYTWNLDRETLGTLFRSLAAEMREDKDLAGWYNRRREAGRELTTALSMGRDRTARLSDVTDYVEKHAAGWAETPGQRNLRWKLMIQGEEAATIRVVGNSEGPLFCYEQDQIGDTLYYGVGGEMFLGTFAEEHNRKENGYEGRVIGRLTMFGDAWLWGFRLYYSRVPLDERLLVLGLSDGSYHYTYFDADRPDRRYTFGVREEWRCSVYGLDGDYNKFTLTATRKGSTEKPTGREVDISDESSGSGKSLPQEKLSNIIEKL